MCTGQHPLESVPWSLSQALPTAGTANGGAKRALLALLREGALREAASVIVYCTFQGQADEVARFLYTSGVSAVSYHARKHMKVKAHGFRAAQVPCGGPAWCGNCSAAGPTGRHAGAKLPKLCLSHLTTALKLLWGLVVSLWRQCYLNVASPSGKRCSCLGLALLNSPYLRLKCKAQASPAGLSIRYA